MKWYNIDRAYGSFFLPNFILDGLKSVPTKCVEPTALENQSYNGYVRTTDFVAMDFNPLK
jgi:hypothetical protein